MYLYMFFVWIAQPTPYNNKMLHIKYKHTHIYRHNKMKLNFRLLNKFFYFFRFFFFTMIIILFSCFFYYLNRSFRWFDWVPLSMRLSHKKMWFFHLNWNAISFIMHPIILFIVLSLQKWKKKKLFHNQFLHMGKRMWKHELGLGETCDGDVDVIATYNTENDGYFQCGGAVLCITKFSIEH